MEQYTPSECIDDVYQKYQDAKKEFEEMIASYQNSTDPKMKLESWQAQENLQIDKVENENQRLRAFFINFNDNLKKINLIDPERSIKYARQQISDMLKAKEPPTPLPVVKKSQLKSFVKQVTNIQKDPTKKADLDTKLRQDIKEHLDKIDEMKKNDPIYKTQRMKDYANEIKVQSTKMTNVAVQYDTPSVILQMMKEENLLRQKIKQEKLDQIQQMKDNINILRDQNSKDQGDIYRLQKREIEIERKNEKLSDDFQFQVMELKNLCAKIENLIQISQKTLQHQIPSIYEKMTPFQQIEFIQLLNQKNSKQFEHIKYLEQEIATIKKEHMKHIPQTSYLSNDELNFESKNQLPKRSNDFLRSEANNYKPTQQEDEFKNKTVSNFAKKLLQTVNQ